MSAESPILAVGFNEDLIQLLGAMVLLAIGILGGILQKRAQDRDRRRQAERRREAQEEGVREPIRPRTNRRPPWIVSEPAPPQAEPAERTRPTPYQTPTPTPPKPARGPEQVAARGRRPTPPPPRPEQPQAPSPTYRPTLGRLGAGPAALRMTGSLSSAPSPGRRARRGKALYGLGDPEQARKAIILHEILSPPKSIRRGLEMWDL